MPPTAEQESAEIRRHNAGQRDYYARRRPVRMEAVDSPYVRLHFERAAAAIALRPGERVLEVGAGMGRFTREFARRGHAVTALELSPPLADACRSNFAGWPAVHVVTGDVLDARPLVGEGFDVVAGFFMLHHLASLDRPLAAIRAVLKPGGRCVFVEPNPWNPLYAVQVTCTPGMSWRHEAGIYRLTGRQLRRAAAAAGFLGLAIRRHGFFPRWLHNRCEASGVNGWLEWLTPAGLRPFQVIAARVADRHE